MNRNKFLKVRVSNEELSKITENADKANMNLSEYIRSSAIKGKIVLYDTKSIVQLTKSINDIGKNINQIAAVSKTFKSVAVGNFYSILADMDILKEKINALTEPFTAEDL